MPAQQTDWTAEKARAIPCDGNRYEVLDGELFVTPAPSLPHQRVLKKLFISINGYVELYGIGSAWLSPADIEFSPRRLVQPDLFVVPDEGAGEPASWRDVTRLLLAVEVLSPTTTPTDRGVKRRIYTEHGVGEYWIVDPSAPSIERWRSGDQHPEILRQYIEWQPRAGLPALQISLDATLG